MLRFLLFRPVYPDRLEPQLSGSLDILLNVIAYMQSIARTNATCKPQGLLKNLRLRLGNASAFGANHMLKIGIDTNHPLIRIAVTRKKMNTDVRLRAGRKKSCV